MLHYSGVMLPALNLKHGLQVIAFNTLIALGIFAFDGHGLISNWVYSQCVGLSIWALIELGHDTLIRDYATQLHRMFWIVPVSVVLGYLAGTAISSALIGNHGVDYLIQQPRQALGFLFVSMTAGGVISYFFVSRELLALARLDLARTQADIEAAQRQATEAQLQLLQSQLEPHMLFNTLANLRALIALDPARAQDMLDRLVAYLRSTLSASRVTSHSLQVEFDRLHDYLELMAVRMGPRLHYTLDLPAALAAQPVPPLLLQPLVENAIKHGLEPKLEGGSITVLARLNDDAAMVLEVHDTGVGLPPNQAPGFGLTQVRERLHTAYGDLVTIELVATSPGSTCARVTFHA
ncbi:MAG TPA: histidine kinase [Rhodoferax sp.]